MTDPNLKKVDRLGEIKERYFHDDFDRKKFIEAASHVPDDIHYLLVMLSSCNEAGIQTTMKLEQLKKRCERLEGALKYVLEGLSMWRKYQSPGNIADVEDRARQALEVKDE